MNKDQKIKFRDRHLQYQYDLLHQLPSITKTPNDFSGLYLKKFYNSTKKYQLNLPSQLTDPMGKFCSKCGVVRVPGINLSMKIVSNQNNNNNNNAASSSLVYYCRLCSNETVSDIIDIQLPSLNSVKTLTSNNKKTLSIHTPNNNINNNNKVKKSENKAKIRAKKRKMNTLSNLLLQKDKENKNKQKSNGLLSLESFMKI